MQVYWRNETPNRAGKRLQEEVQNGSRPQDDASCHRSNLFTIFLYFIFAITIVQALHFQRESLCKFEQLPSREKTGVVSFIVGYIVTFFIRIYLSKPRKNTALTSQHNTNSAAFVLDYSLSLFKPLTLDSIISSAAHPPQYKQPTKLSGSLLSHNQPDFRSTRP